MPFTYYEKIGDEYLYYGDDDSDELEETVHDRIKTINNNINTNLVNKAHS